LLARSQNMWACVYTSAGVCAGVFARARTYACISIVRAHACICRVRMRACTLCGRMLACDCVHVRSVGARAHVCMCGCVCACACACMRVYARVRVCVRSRAYVCQGACVSARARPYASCACACGFSRGCGVLSQRNNTADRRGPPVEFLHIYIPFFPLPFLFPLLFHSIIISLYNMNTHIYAYISMNSLIYDFLRLHTETAITRAQLCSYGT